MTSDLNSKPRVDLEALTTQRAVLSVLMNSPELRGQVLQKYPGRFEGFFSINPARSILKAIMLTPGIAVPPSIEHRVPELLDTEWSPQSVYDYASPDAGIRFWDDVEALRSLAKKRMLIANLQEALKNAQHAENIDTYARQVTDNISKITADTSMVHNPRISAVADKYERNKAEGKLGRRVPTRIPRLDDALGGGLRIDPGELFGIAGYEKQRKTTLLINIISSWHHAQLEGGTVWVCNEESVDSIDLMAQLWAIEASRMAIIRRIGGQSGTHFRPDSFSREDVAERADTFGDRAKQCVQDAFNLVKTWDIRIYAAGMDDGNAGDFETVMAQCLAEAEFGSAKRFVFDNLQGWRQGNEGDYEALNRVVPRIAAMTGRYQCLTGALSQYSRGGQIKGSGGFEGRTNLVLGTSYDEQASADYMGVKKRYGRNRGFFDIKDLRIDKKSGLIVDGWFAG